MSAYYSIKVLAVAANPADTSDIKSNHIYKAIGEGIHKAEQSDRVEILPPVLVASWDDMRTALEQHRPDILHLIGHGSRLDEFVLEDRSGNRQKLDKEALAAHLAHYKSDLKVVVITACHSYLLAKALERQGIPAAIGKDEALNRDHAAAFTASFYHYLVMGNSLQVAIEKVYTALQPDIRRTDLPTLITNLPGYYVFDNSRLSLREQLKQGSRMYFERFVREEIKLPPNELTSLFDTLQVESAFRHLETSLQENWRSKRASVLVEGARNCGKTICCLRLWQQYNHQLDSPTVLYVPCKELEDEDHYDLVSKKLILTVLSDKYCRKPFPEQEDLDRLSNEFLAVSSNTQPAYLLILDGYKDLAKSREKVLRDLSRSWITPYTAGVQVMLTSRFDMLDSQPLLRAMHSYSIPENFLSVQSPQPEKPKLPIRRSGRPCVYVITGTQECIAEAYSAEHKHLLKKIPKQRYHNKQPAKWRPYLAESTIKEIFAQFQQRYNLPFEERYIGAEIGEADWDYLMENLSNIIGILDLLAISSKNRKVARCFDTNHSGGVIVPACRKTLNQAADLREFFEKSRREVLGSRERRWASGHNFTRDFYGREHRDLISFREQLRLNLKGQFSWTTHQFAGRDTAKDNHIRDIIKLGI